MEKILIINFLLQIKDENIENSIKIFNQYNKEEKYQIIYLFTTLEETFFVSNNLKDVFFKYFVNNNLKNIFNNNLPKIEEVIFADSSFHSICKDLLIKNKFSRYSNIFYKKMIKIISDDRDYIFQLIKFTNNLDILKNNQNIYFSYKQKKELLELVKKKNINDCYLKELIINKIGFYDDILLQFKDKPTIEDINLFKKHFLKIQNLKKIKNMVINIFFNYIHQYNIEDLFRKDLFINFVLEHSFIYKTIKTPLITSLNKTHYTMFDDVFNEIDEIFVQIKNLENF